MSALLAQAAVSGDPLYQGSIDLAVVLITLLKVVICFVFLLVATMFMVWFERKVIAGMQNRVGPNKAGPFGLLQTLADGIKSFFKERIKPERADPLRLPPGAVPGLRTGVPRLHRDPGRWRLRRRQRRCGHDLRPRDVPAGGRSSDRHPVRPGPQLHRGVRHHAGRLVVRIEVPAARLGPGVGPDGELRSGTRAVRRHRDPRGRHPVHQRHRGGPGDAAGLERRRHGGAAVRGVRHRRHRRAQPAAVRPGGGRAGAGGRVQHRVLVDRLRPLLPGRVHEHGDHVGRHRDACSSVALNPCSASTYRSSPAPSRA